MSLKIVVVGGVAGGASAAAKARRENETAEIHIYERGEFLSFANCGLPYFIGGEIHSQEKLLLMTPQKFWDKYRIYAHIHHEVLSIHPEKKKIKVQNQQGQVESISYDKLILSQGASPIVPPFEGHDLPHVFTLRNIPNMLAIHRYIAEKSPKHAVVIGGGFIGLEMAEAFMNRGLNVSIVEKMPHVLPQLDRDMAVAFESRLKELPLQLYTGQGAKAFTEDQVLLENGESLPADLILVSIGVKPEIEMAREAGLIIGKTGGVYANGRMESSDRDIYVVGDAAETTHFLTGSRVRMPLAGPANRQGRIAGANAAGAHLMYRGTLGTSIVRVEEHVIATTGLNTRLAEQGGFSFFSSITRDPNHASYYPGASPVVIKLLCQEGSGQILGAQVLGKEGVDKRIDVLATAIMAKMTVFDLEHLDLAYSPPFNSAKDPVNIAGYVASHEVRGDIRLIAPENCKDVAALFLDVRNPGELETHGQFKGAVNIPLSQLRNRLNELPQSEKIVVYCQKGQRGYLASKILMQQGFKQVYNLKGGFLQAKQIPELDSILA